MSYRLVHQNSPLLAAFTEESSRYHCYHYETVRGDADSFAREHGLVVADMPLLIQTMSLHPEIREHVQREKLDVLSMECHGQRAGDPSYEVWHSAGTLLTAKGFATRIRKVRGGFYPITKREWDAVGTGDHKGSLIHRLHLDDVRRGEAPPAGVPYTIFVRLETDDYNIHKSGLLSYDSFMRDDRVLMVAGSLENRAFLARIFFCGKGKEEVDGRYARSLHHIKDTTFTSFTSMAEGRPLAISLESSTLWYSDLHGRFAAVLSTAQNAGLSLPSDQQG